MSALDNLGPQFNPSGDVYGGVDSEFRFSRVSPSGEVKRVGRGTANMQGKNRSEDLQLNLPTGATTDFRAPAMHPSDGSPPDFSSKFKPAELPSPENGGTGRYN
jgi:hypothetical protein